MKLLYESIDKSNYRACGDFLFSAMVHEYNDVLKRSLVRGALESFEVGAAGVEIMRRLVPRLCYYFLGELCE